MASNSQLNEAQISVLRSLHFWRRNLYVASIHQDLIECIKSRKAIFHLFKSCDQLDIPFAIQNRVIYAASQKRLLITRQKFLFLIWKSV